MRFQTAEGRVHRQWRVPTLGDILLMRDDHIRQQHKGMPGLLAQACGRETVSEDKIDEQELLALFNGWLDCERFNNDLTEEEQDACWIVLDIVKRHQEGKL